jgi:hypothetical protein
LDEELALLPGVFTPRLYEQLTRLGSWAPFAAAAKLLQNFTGVAVGAAPERRKTASAGAALVRVQARECERLEQAMPLPPVGPAKQLLRVDGAMVPLVGKGQWAEAKTLAMGRVEAPVLNKQGEPEVHCVELSYFSRLAEIDSFIQQAYVEIHRRGVERAGTVSAVVDGADWCQSFLDFYRPDARRILDFPHAGGRVKEVGRVIYGEANPAGKEWESKQCTSSSMREQRRCWR